MNMAAVVQLTLKMGWKQVGFLGQWSHIVQLSPYASGSTVMRMFFNNGVAVIALKKKEAECGASDLLCNFTDGYHACKQATRQCFD
jgi:hypothetical protein